jgi:recombinational DNA repair ATPase RecF
MSTKSVVITEVVRRRADVKEDRLLFQSGVNVLVGDPNTGKTKWMETIDFLLGDSITPEQRETDDIYMKYDSAHMTAHIGGDKYEIARRWKEKGVLTKVGSAPESDRTGISSCFPESHKFGSGCG